MQLPDSLEVAFYGIDNAKLTLILLYSMVETLCILFPLIFTTQVDTAWVRRYNGTGNEHDIANDVVVDNLGYVYVTGGSKGLGSDYDYATIKYNPNGDTAWVRRYNGSLEFGGDMAYAIAVDSSGNVYVTGNGNELVTGEDYVTIKYYPNGDTAWVRRYDGPGYGWDYSYSIAVDNSGNVYVTGESDKNYATIKYYPNGDTAWVRRYHHSETTTLDEAKAIAVDNSGNVYVTGFSNDSITLQDYTTIKYYPNGDTAWVRRYDGGGNYTDQAYSIAVDNSGCVYVTGGSCGPDLSTDYATIKYNPNGDTAWVRRYNGPEDWNDEASAIVVDDSGNAYVTGNSGGLYYTTIKYYSNGDTAWVRKYNGPVDNVNMAFAIAIDNSSNVFVTGRSAGSGTNDDYATVKYYPYGDTAWVRRYNGPGNYFDWAHSIAVDNSGNVYVTGESNGSDTNDDYATIKYNSTGDIEENHALSSSPKLKFEIQPNPARNYFTIRFARLVEYPAIRIFDFSGREVRKFTVKAQSLEKRISLNGIRPGVYFVKINDDVTIKKLIVTK